MLLVRMRVTPEMIRPGAHLKADREHLYQADQGEVLWPAPEPVARIHTNPNGPHQGVKAPWLDSTGLNDAGVNAP